MALLNDPNHSEWLKPKFETSDLHSPNSGHPGPRFNEVNEVLMDVFDFDWLDMLDIAEHT